MLNYNIGIYVVVVDYFFFGIIHSENDVFFDEEDEDIFDKIVFDLKANYKVFVINYYMKVNEVDNKN